ncbi:3-hydroxyisobutyrate dehydrogenase [Dyella jiangningensis]|uniref:NAD(P)-dependent oxidoreductase n=2 Tax=Gammaproteobacteria TaxID=1236 RepID=UPI0008839BEB|nr:NAD(P)-dependent oxidoreductase [Dyella sp. AtDHG13]PXV58597.1 3-hydroxyisobutyrate dehydrogenase-like beta-hydroxyacid dehydrogenase [Dyella sp. AtDHG13]SDL13956.1 3-hydroxyisobutyrate dehydrogenase [Dyella jiangningensis]
MKVGFIGLGSMGSAMASNLIKAGYEVTVWNRSPAATEPLASLGAKVAKTADRAAQGEVLFSMLANDQAVRSVFFDDGLLDGMDKGIVHVNHATISVALAREMAHAHASRGLDYVAAPVFGRPDVAAAGKLNILAAGKPTVIDRVRPMLDAMGSRIWPLGDAPERANVVKIAGNFMLGAAIESMAEASALTRAHGVSAADFLEVMTSTLFAAPAYQGYGKLIAESRYTPAGFALPLGYKDIGLALAAADATRVPLPLAGLLRDSLLEALSAGDEDVDWSIMAQVAARRAHLDERKL